MKQIKLFLMLSTTVLVLSNCTFENRKITTQKCFKDLDIHIQDTLKNLPIDTLGYYPDIIALVGHYRLIMKEIGPWYYAKKIENIETKKSYWFYYNTPGPFIITSKEIIFPAEYNVIIHGIEKTDKFNVINIH